MGGNYQKSFIRQLDEMTAKLERLESAASSGQAKLREYQSELDRVSKIADNALDQVDTLKTENAGLKAKLSDLQTKYEIVCEENMRLRSILNNDSNNSSNPPSTDQKPSRKSANEYNGRTSSGKRTGGQPGHKGCTLTKKDIEEQIKAGKVEHKIMTHGKESPSYVTKYVVDVPTMAIVTEHRFYADEHGDYHIPENMRSDIIYGENIRILIGALYVKGNMSISRIKEHLSEFHLVSLSEGTICNILNQLSERAQPSIEKLENGLLNSAVVGTDATFISTGGVQTYIRNQSTEKYVLYSEMDKKSLDVMKQTGILSRFTGTFIHDHETTMYHFGLKHGECNVHMLRYLRKNNEDTGHEWSSKMIGFLSSANKERNERKKAGISSFTDEELKAYEEKYAQILALGKSENADCSPQWAKQDENALLNRLEKYRENHLLFLYDFSVPFDNNMSERDLRPCKRRQKVSGGFRKKSGVVMYCRLLSVVETAKRHLVNLREAFLQINRNQPAF